MTSDATLLEHAKHFLGRFGLQSKQGTNSKPRRLGRVQPSSTPGYSARRLNKIASKMAACDRYLEVGVAQGLTLERIEIPLRWGVDPEPQFDTGRIPRGIEFFEGTSDEFFRQIDSRQEFDLVFLDGLHIWQQTYRDLLSTLNHASRGALVLIDDVVPDDALSAMTDYAAALAAKDAAGIHDGRWHGDVFKVLRVIEEHHPELKFVLLRNSGERSDNPQALVWVDSDMQPNYDLTLVDDRHTDYDTLRFDDVFGDSAAGGTLNILEEDVAIEIAIRAIAS